MISRNEEFRYGSARWADYDDIASAGMFDTAGLPIGYFENHLLRFESDAPRLTIGGAGSGKLRDILGEVLCRPCHTSMAVLDPRGELWEISWPLLAAQGIYGYNWDPYKVTGLCHSINPLEHLTPDNSMLFADIIRLVRALLPLSASSSGKYFELTAQNVLAAQILHEVLVFGKIDFPRLHKLIHIIEGDLSAWADVLESMLGRPELFLRSAANVIMTRQQDAPKEFGAVMGEIYANMVWLNDDKVRASLKSGGCSLFELVDGKRPVRIHFTVPGDLLEFCSPILRVFFDSIMAIKARRRSARRILLLIDEAAMLGKFEALRTAFTFGRGSGLITWIILQDLGQLETNFGRSGIQTFLGSAAMRQFFGVNDHITANVVSQMAGYETLEYDDEGRQAQAEHQMMQNIHAIMDGADPFENARAFEYHRQSSQRRSKIRRPLIDPAEVLNMGADEMITFISGKDIPPIRANKYPYFEQLKAGQFFPNSNHPPIDRIRVKSLWGHKTLAVNRVAVPQKYAHFPQFACGYALQIEGQAI